MFDHDTWMRHGADRQELIAKLKRIIIDKEENMPLLGCDLVPVILHQLVTMSKQRVSPLPRSKIRSQREAKILFRRTLLPQIKAFAPDKEEQVFIMTKLAEEALASVTGQACAAFSMWESRK